MGYNYRYTEPVISTPDLQVGVLMTGVAKYFGLCSPLMKFEGELLRNVFFEGSIYKE